MTLIKKAAGGDPAALNNTCKQKLPPYGRSLPKTLRELWIYCGSDAWSYVPAHGRTLLPPGESPSAFRWPVAGLEVLVIQTGAVAEATLLELRDVLLRAAANVVRIVAENEAGASYMTIHQPVVGEGSCAA